MSINDLPSELVLSIAEFVVNSRRPISDDRLTDLRRVSKVFDQHLTALIYGTIDNVDLRRYIAKIRTYVLHAHLRPHLRKARINRIDRNPVQPPPSAAWLNDANTQLRTIPNAPPAARRQTLIQHARRGSDDALAAILFHFCPRVREVHIEQEPDANLTPNYCPLTRVSLRPPYNTTLQRLEVVHDPGDWSWDAGYLWIPMLQCPELKYLSMTSINFEAVSTAWRNTLPPNVDSELESFILGESILLPQSLQAIGLACPNLKNLDIEFYDPNHFPPHNTPQINADIISPWRYGRVLGATPNLPPAMQPAPLFPHLTSLRFLMELTTDTFPHGREHYLDLSRFSALQSIEISDWLLFDRPRVTNLYVQVAAHLPHSLHKLKIKPSIVERPLNLGDDQQYTAAKMQLHSHIEAELAGLVSREEFGNLELVVAYRHEYLVRLFGDGEGPLPTLSQYNAVPKGFAWVKAGLRLTSAERAWVDSVEPVDTYAKACRGFADGLRMIPI